MPQVRPDSVFVEYVFTPEEEIAAKVLTPLQQQWLSTRLSQTVLEKASCILPESHELDRSHVMKLAELEGRILFIQELMNNHLEALKAQQNLNETSEVVKPSEIFTNTAARASHLVDGV